MTKPTSAGVHLFIGLLLVFSAAGCLYLPRAARVPMRSISVSVTTAPSKTLIVFLPGRGDSMNDFAEKGLLATLREAGPAVDVVCVDAHMGYYLSGTIAQRLRDDVLRPARGRGYTRIVAVGISLGGLGALLTERDQRDSFDALVLIAPYLGNDALLFGDITKAGGPARWAGLGRRDSRESIAEIVWTYLGERCATLPETWLLFGENDRYRAGQQLLAGLLPSSHVTILPGKHDWATWNRLWRSACATPGLLTADNVGAASGIAARH